MVEEQLHDGSVWPAWDKPEFAVLKEASSVQPPSGSCAVLTINNFSTTSDNAQICHFPHSPMPQPDLPLELHQLIIDFVGEEAIVRFIPISRVEKAVRNALQSCSFVCKDWHAHTVRYMFHDLWIYLFRSGDACKRHGGLLRLLEVNPLIGRCVRRILLDIRGGQEVTAELIGNLCRDMSSVETLRLRLSEPFQRFPIFPSPLNGLYHLLASPHLRDLSIFTQNLPLRLLEIPPNLRSLTLQEVVSSVPAEDLYEEHQKRASCSTTLEKLTVKHAHQVLDSIASAAQGSLSAFFDNIKYLDMTFYDTYPHPNSQWSTVLARWRCLETMIMDWRVNGKSFYIYSFGDVVDVINAIATGHDSSFFVMCQSIPWSSFQGLRSLTCGILCLKLTQEEFNTAEISPSSLFLAGPSCLPQLRHLHITYRNETFISGPEELDIYLNTIFLHQINRTIERRDSFPVLQQFHVALECVSELSKLQESVVVKRLVERLPAVFGIGGRCETRGWATSIKASVGWPF